MMNARPVIVHPSMSISQVSWVVLSVLGGLTCCTSGGFLDLSLLDAVGRLSLRAEVPEGLLGTKVGQPLCHDLDYQVE